MIHFENFVIRISAENMKTLIAEYFRMNHPVGNKHFKSTIQEKQPIFKISVGFFLNLDSKIDKLVIYLK